MKISHIISLLLFTLILISCTSEKNYSIEIKEGVEIIKNKNIESTPDLKLELKLISEMSLDDLVLPDSIPAISSFSKAVLDEDGNLYISSFRSSVVYKIDPEGRYLTNFHKKGQGPGESLIIDDIDVIDNSVYVVGESGKVAVYTKTGDFIKQLRLIDGKFAGLQLYNSRKDIICATRTSKYVPEENKTDWTIGIFLLDTEDMEKYSKILEINSSVDLNNYRYFMNNEQRRSCFYNRHVYFEDLSFDEYAIDVYDLNAKKIKRIEKQTRRIACSEKFKTEVKEKGKKAPWVKLVADYMKQILWMYVDKNGNLWVCPAVEGLETSHHIYDIFNPDGIFLKRIQLPVPDSFKQISFDNGKLIARDIENCVIKIFDYEFL